MGTTGSRARGALRALHERLLPKRSRHSWLPYLWLFWLLGFFQKWFIVPVEPVELTLAVCTAAAFVPLYFNGYWRDGHRLLVTAAGCVLIGILWFPFNIGAMPFFVYGSAFVGRAVRPRQAFIYLGGIVLLLASESLLVGMPPAFLLFGPPVCLVVGSATVHLAETRRQESALKLSQAEVRRLATVAERERIARDLHDLLGHTLSMIAIKAELAAKLSARGDARAEQEIRDVESVTRDALRQVREAVTGFRRTNLDGELANASLACEARGIAFVVDSTVTNLPEEQEAVLAMCLREAITNVIRHSNASRCHASLAREGSWIRLTVDDDGQSRAIREGTGLAGMRERVEQAGGQMTIHSVRGVTLTIHVPVDAESGRPELLASGREMA